MVPAADNAPNYGAADVIAASLWPGTVQQGALSGPHASSARQVWWLVNAHSHLELRPLLVVYIRAETALTRGAAPTLRP